ncbi:unnamed protein product, partial [Prorocentrum cordatum]
MVTLGARSRRAVAAPCLLLAALAQWGSWCLLPGGPGARARWVASAPLAGSQGSTPGRAGAARHLVCREAAKKKAAATTKKAAAATTKKAAAKTTKAAGATAVKDGDVICLRSHNGNYINAEPGNDIVS